MMGLTTSQVLCSSVSACIMRINQIPASRKISATRETIIILSFFFQDIYFEEWAEYFGDCITSCNKVENCLVSEYDPDLAVLVERRARRWSTAAPPGRPSFAQAIHAGIGGTATAAGGVVGVGTTSGPTHLQPVISSVSHPVQGTTSVNTGSTSGSHEGSLGHHHHHHHHGVGSGFRPHHHGNGHDDELNAANRSMDVIDEAADEN